MSRKSATTNPPDKTAQPVRVYRLKISLKNTDPVIWRRLEVPGDLPMNYLAGTIETVFGWSGSHCAEFVIKERRIGDGTDWRHVDATANVAEIESLLKSLQRGQTGKKESRCREMPSSPC